MKIVLASTSPGRKYLMKKLGVKFKAVDSGYRERRHKHLSPTELVKFLAWGKARTVLKRYPRSIIIAADTVVVFRDQILGKPKNKSAARKMLRLLSGKINYVIRDCRRMSF